MEDLFKPKFVNLPYKPEEVKPISPEAVSGYFDASPVRILYGGIQSNIREKEETIVYEAAVNMGVDVDKEKLLHALALGRENEPPSRSGSAWRRGCRVTRLMALAML